MGIQSIADYVQFYMDLGIVRSIRLIQFIYNERSVLQHKLETKSPNKEAISHGIKILDDLIAEVKELGEEKVLEKYSKK